MKLGFVYPQTELDGNARALHEIGIAVEALGYDSSRSTTTSPAPSTPIVNLRSLAPTPSATRSTIRWLR